MSDQLIPNEPPAAPAAAPAPAPAPAPVTAPVPVASAPINVTVNQASAAGMGTLAQLPAGVYLSSPWKRLAGYLIDMALISVTLGIGWLIWGAIVAAKGQTPGRQLLGMRVVAIRDGRPMSWGAMVFLRGLVGAFIASLAFICTLGVLAFMPLWDRNNQTIIDKVSSALVVDDPNGVYR